MTSFLIISRDKDKRIAYTKTFCEEHAINPFDISLIEVDTTGATAKQSIGIEDVKRIQKTVFLKPIKSKVKAVIIEDAHLLTIEAQNALLKVLEEPPEHTLLLLGTETRDSLLPTILSRCQIVQLGNDELTLTTRERNAITEFLAALPTMSIGDRLKKAELLAKDKDKAISWVEKVIVVSREIIINEYINSTDSKAFDVTMLYKLQELHQLLKTTNTNPRLALEHTFLTMYG